MATGQRTGWTPARRAAAVLGAALLLVSYGLFTGGVALLWSERHRADGFVWGPQISSTTSGYALVSDDVHLDTSGVQALVDVVVDTVRVEVTPSDPTEILFVGLARSADAAGYLDGVAHRQVGELGQGGATWGWLGPGVTTDRAGGPPSAAPGDVGIWLAESVGVGTQTLTWPLVDGDWVIVVMQSDGSPGVAVTARTGAAAPALRWIAGGMVLVALVLLSLGGRLVWSTRESARMQPPDAIDADATGTPEDPSRAEEKVPVLPAR